GFLSFRGRETWQQWAAIPLQLVGVYAIAIGFANRLGIISPLLRVDSRWLISPNIFVFSRANSRILRSLIVLGILNSGCLAMLASIPILLVVAAYAVFHFAVVMPVAYIAYLLSGVPLAGLNDPANSWEFSPGVDLYAVLREQQVEVAS